MSHFNLRKSRTTWKWNRAFQFMKKKIISSSNIFSCLLVNSNLQNHFLLTVIILPLLVAQSDQQPPKSITHRVLFLSFYFLISFKNAGSSFLWFEASSWGRQHFCSCAPADPTPWGSPVLRLFPSHFLLKTASSAGETKCPWVRFPKSSWESTKAAPFCV